MKYFKPAILNFLWALFGLLDASVLLFLPFRWNKEGQREPTIFGKIAFNFQHKWMMLKND